MSDIERLHAAALNRSARRQDGVAVSFSLIPRTLPLSGSQGAWGGEAESCWRPVHSKGLLAGRVAQASNS